MTTPTRTAPAGRVGLRPPAPRRATGPAPRAPDPPREPVSFDRVFRWALVLSVVIHLVILVLSPLFIRIGPPPGGLVGERAAAPAFDGLRGIIPIASSDAADAQASQVAEAADAPRPTSATTPAEAAATPAVPESSAGTPDAPAAGRTGGEVRENAPGSAGEALRPGYRDSRLWVNPRELRVEAERSRHEQYMEHLQARIDAANDSTYGRGPDTDWTTRDSRGRRWGVSEDGIHLGGITIPRQVLPIPSTGTTQDQEEERERARQREEIQRQEDDRARERAREQTRKAAEERRRRGGGNGGGGDG